VVVIVDRLGTSSSHRPKCGNRRMRI
jgi:hypothetical protein